MNTPNIAGDNPGFIELLKQAALEERTLVFSGPGALKRAQTCRFRIYKMRTDMKKAGHELSDLVSRVELRIRERAKPDVNGEPIYSLIASPGGDDFAKELKAAGIEIAEAPSLDEL